ncbi:hypothetical protein OOZ15_13805 [Galbibacter sp. EGI 63066]|uniref:hypothetical protein n=1 Tax=Galbibacter sp. EGI 63066 TaxID=2993559 RepID=UPI002248C298|nr:hypothetical protein [Galbibacter sp. EGI 63066]MCX2681023.1 hypothetical protein [Galbibacter sp. EGI 63066]
MGSTVTLEDFDSFAATPVVFHDGIAEDIYTDQDEYKEIEISEPPQAVLQAVETDYPDVTFKKACINEVEEYNIQITDATQVSNLYVTQTGE